MPTLSLLSRWESGYCVWVQRHAYSQAVVSVGIRLMCLGGATCLPAAVVSVGIMLMCLGGAICLLAVCCLGGNQANMSEWSDMHTRRLLSRWESG
jgi:peptidoglycan/LPS O-acetylase OafA/YrhL